jgi:uncharacterized protein (DUF302 family)
MRPEAMRGDPAMTEPPGVITKVSPRSVADTVAAVVELLDAKRIKVFVTIDQRAEAEQVGLTLRATTLIVFGNPVAGTPVMAKAPTAGLDLPLKILVWDDDGRTQLSFFTAEAIAARHDLPTELAAKLDVVDGITDAVIESLRPR